MKSTKPKDLRTPTRSRKGPRRKLRKSGSTSKDLLPFAVVFDAEKHAAIWPFIFKTYFNRKAEMFVGTTAELEATLRKVFKERRFAGVVLDLHFGINPTEKEIGGVALWLKLKRRWIPKGTLQKRTGRVLLYSVNTSGTAFVMSSVERFRREVDADFFVGLPMLDRVRAIQYAFSLTPNDEAMRKLGKLHS